MSEIRNAPGVIGFLGYRLVNVHYECAPDFEMSSLPDGQYHFTFTKTGSLLSETQYQLNLTVRICFGTEVDYTNAPFLLEVELAGRYDCQEGWDKRWESNALAILFPYLRAIVSIITAQSGREPVLLPTVNIVQMFREASEQKEKSIDVLPAVEKTE